MLNHQRFLNYGIIVSFFIAALISSCASTKKTVYFNDLPDTSKLRELVPVAFKQPVIQSDDILTIIIQTIDPAESAVLNQVNSPTGTATASAAQAPSGYLVDENGNVEIPILGVIKVAGLTTKEARDVIRNEAAKYNKNPSVQLRFANYKVTVLGEVNKPSSYNVPNEKVTVLDAISLAGDLTIFGQRQNIMLIRDNGAKKEVVRLDLTSSSLFQSPYFYLKQNDVIYVAPGKGRIASNNAATTQIIAIGVSVITLLVTIITRL